VWGDAQAGSVVEQHLYKKTTRKHSTLSIAPSFWRGTWSLSRRDVVDPSVFYEVAFILFSVVNIDGKNSFSFRRRPKRFGDVFPRRRRDDYTPRRS